MMFAIDIRSHRKLLYMQLQVSSSLDSNALRISMHGIYMEDMSKREALSLKLCVFERHVYVSVLFIILHHE